MRGSPPLQCPHAMKYSECTWAPARTLVYPQARRCAAPNPLLYWLLILTNVLAHTKPPLSQKTHGVPKPRPLCWPRATPTIPKPANALCLIAQSQKVHYHPAGSILHGVPPSWQQTVCTQHWQHAARSLLTRCRSLAHGGQHPAAQSSKAHYHPAGRPAPSLPSHHCRSLVLPACRGAWGHIGL